MGPLKLILIFFTLFFVSCEKVFVIKADHADNNVVVNTIFNNNEPFSAEITKSFSPYGDIEVQELKNATVSLFENGKFIEDLVYSKLPGDSLGKFRSLTIPAIKKEYKIEVIHTGLGKAIAKSTVPDSIKISAETVNWTEWGVDNSTSVRYNFSFALQDPADKNYYYLTMRFPVNKLNETTGKFEFYAYQYAEILTGDLPGHQLYIRNGLLFSDNIFNDMNYVITGTATTFQYAFGDYLPADNFYYGDNENFKVDFSRLYICLHHLSKELYNFYSSHAVKLGNDNNLFSEPTLIYSNVENGKGIFGGENTTEKKVEIEY